MIMEIVLVRQVPQNKDHLLMILLLVWKRDRYIFKESNRNRHLIFLNKMKNIFIFMLEN